MDLQLKPAEPPPVLYHGTPERNLRPVLGEGLKRIHRHHVHLYADKASATKVGARRGRPVVLAVDARAMRRDSHTFYLSGNGVWLVEHVPPRYLKGL